MEYIVYAVLVLMGTFMVAGLAIVAWHDYEVDRAALIAFYDLLWTAVGAIGIVGILAVNGPKLWRELVDEAARLADRADAVALKVDPGALAATHCAATSAPPTVACQTAMQLKQSMNDWHSLSNAETAACAAHERDPVLGSARQRPDDVCPLSTLLNNANPVAVCVAAHCKARDARRSYLLEFRGAAKAFKQEPRLDAYNELMSQRDRTANFGRHRLLTIFENFTAFVFAPCIALAFGLRMAKAVYEYIDRSRRRGLIAANRSWHRWLYRPSLEDRRPTPSHAMPPPTAEPAVVTPIGAVAPDLAPSNAEIPGREPAESRSSASAEGTPPTAR